MTPEQDHDISQIERVRVAKPNDKSPANNIRNKGIWILYTHGFNLTELGEMFGLSRERIRMIINRFKTTIGLKSE